MKAVCNFLWVQSGSDSEGNTPNTVMPTHIERNIKNIADHNPEVDMILWVDYKKLSPEKIRYLETIADDNLVVRNLRDLASYTNLKDTDGKSFFDAVNNNPGADKDAVLWRQVDVARIMATLETAQEGYDQIFYADADIRNLDISAQEIQAPLEQYGVVLARGWAGGDFENGFLGFSAHQSHLVEQLLASTIDDAVDLKVNGFWALKDWANTVILPELDVENSRSITWQPQFIVGKPTAISFAKQLKNRGSDDIAR